MSERKKNHGLRSCGVDRNYTLSDHDILWTVAVLFPSHRFSAISRFLFDRAQLICVLSLVTLSNPAIFNFIPVTSGQSNLPYSRIAATHRRFNHSYLPGGANVHPRLMYRSWTHPFQHPKVQTASRSVQPILDSSRQGVPIHVLYNGPPFPLKIPASRGGPEPHLIGYMVLWAHYPTPHPKRRLDRLSRFLQGSRS